MSISKKYQYVYKFLSENHMGVLSTVNADGKPWGSAIYFVVDEDFIVYFVTRMETYKFKNLDKNKHVALTVTDEASQKTVQLAGNISKVEPKDYLEIVFTKLAGIRPKNNLDWAPPIEKIHKGDYIPLKITPTKLLYADFKNFKKSINAEYIEEII